MSKLHKKASLIALASLTAAFFGCASIAKGTKQLVTINSNVNGATVLLDGVEIGLTPFVGEIVKGKNMITVRKNGYSDQQVALSKELEGAFWGNIISGGTIGSITDFATGAAYSYAPANYQVDLQANSQASASFQREYAVRKFSMLYHSKIAADASLGEGEYLNALADLVSPDAPKSQTFAKIQKALAISGGSQVKFGNEMVQHIHG